MNPKKLIFILFLLSFIAVPSLLWCQSTPNVPVDDPVYRDIDKLIAAGLVKDVIYGQRPWSRTEINRIVAVTIKNREENDTVAWVDPILHRLTIRFHEEPNPIRLSPLEQARFDYTFLDSPPRAVSVSNGLGQMNAVINPLTNYQEGRHYAEGHTLALETTHTANLSRYFSLYARPRFELLLPHSGTNQAQPIVQNLYGKFAYRNLDLEVGRDSLVWGQGEYGGLILSNNARPLDMVKLSTASPFYLPWIFQYAGPTSFQLFFADLGPEREYPHSILSGYKLTIKPVTFFEVGVNYDIIMGGDGAVSPSLWEAVSEYTGVLTAIHRNRGIPAFTNRIFSLEGRWILPFLRNSVFYAEIGFDDTNQELKVLFEDNAIYYSGIYIPRLTNDGSLDLRIEYKHIPAVTYRHSQYVSGNTLNRRILGDELGPDSDGVLVKINAQINDQLTVTPQFVYERRDSDFFTTVTQGGDAIDIVKIQQNPAESRFRVEDGFLFNVKKGFCVEFKLGYEHVRNFNFVAASEVDNFIGQLALTLEPELFE